MLKKILIIIIPILIITGCSSKKEVKDPIQEIISKNNYIIVDVRTAEEFETGHLDSAINIPVDEIENIDLNKFKTILVYCKSGVRSKRAYDYLINNGYTAYDLGAYSSINKDLFK